jgi:competence protein ComEC
MIANHKGEIPVVVLLLPFLFGIGLGIDLLSNADVLWLTWVFVILSAVFILLNLNYNRFKLYKNRWLGGIFITLILFVFGWLLVINYNELNSKDHFSKTPSQYLLVKINNEPILKNGLLRFTADVEESINKGKKNPVSGTLLIAIKDTAAKNLYYGDELLIPAKYNEVQPPFIPAEFNYKKYLANQNIFYQAFFYPKQFVLIRSNTGNPLIAYSLRLRQHLVGKLKLNMRDTDAIAVASTLILGYKADLSNDVLQAYSKTGTVHVLSVSGAHVAIIYVMLATALGFLDKFKHGKLIKSFIIILLIWYYSMLSGFSPAVCRAAVMISMVITGRTFSRYINTLNILAISAFVLLVYDPFFINDVGFQLSYLAVSGLIVFQPLVYKWFTFKNKWRDKLWALCSVSIAAQVITFPLSAFYFHQFPVYFLVGNLFIIIPSTIIMYSGVLCLLLPQIPVLSAAIAFVLEKTIILMNKGLAIVEHTPYASINKIWITPSEYLLMYVVIISLFCFLYYKKGWLLYSSLMALLFFFFIFNINYIMLNRKENITWLNLKKHKGIIFKQGNAAVVLSDLKPTDKVYQYSIQPYLDSCHITNTRTIQMNEDIHIFWFMKKYNYIQFLNKKIFIVDRSLHNQKQTPKLLVDYVYLLEDQNSTLEDLDGNFKYNLLVVDAGFTDRKLNTIKRRADSINVNYKILKRNNSIISVSN